MPFKAYRDRMKTIYIEADQTKISDKGKTFYCQTPGCKVEYSIVNPGSEEDAFFRRKPSSPHHISSDCARSSMTIHEQKYNETLFSTANLFNYVLKVPGAPTHKGNTGTKHVHVGGTTAIRTLRNFYALVCARGIASIYNGIPLSDIFANDDNFSYFMEHLQGQHIVEASYYCLADPETILFNYPCDWRSPHIIIALRFPGNHQKCIEYNDLFSSHSHNEPIILAGNWYTWNVKGTVHKVPVTVEYACDYISSRQIFDPN